MKYLKNLIIESDSTNIDYPSYLNNYGPWMYLYQKQIFI